MYVRHSNISTLVSLYKREVMIFRLLFLLLLVSLNASAQKPLKGNLIYVLGNDTTMAGTYSLDGYEFEIKVLSRPNVTVTTLKGRLFANGELQSAQGNTWKPLLNGELKQLSTIRLGIANDSTFIGVQETNKPQNIFAFEGRGMTANAIGTPFRYLLPLWARFAPVNTGDSMVSTHLTMNTRKPFMMKRIAADKIYAGSSVMGMLTLHTNKDGEVNYIDGIGSSWNVMGYVVAELDMDAMTARFVGDEQNGKGITVVNKADSVITKVGDANIKIVYSRPLVRGRKIFGAVVPYNKVWRTGANAATKFITDKDLLFGDKTLPAGSYSLWTLPTEKGWTLIFNSKHTTWGTEYKSENDMIHIRMQTKSNPFTELFAININSNDSKASLELIWENLKAWVEFSTK
jgi:hypothetical protein